MVPSHVNIYICHNDLKYSIYQFVINFCLRTKVFIPVVGSSDVIVLLDQGAQKCYVFF